MLAPNARLRAAIVPGLPENSSAPADEHAIRHKLPVLVIISLNGGWTADPKKIKPGRDLGYTRFDEIAKVLGCHGEYVEKPEDIQPALQRAKQAVAKGQSALVNVVTDRARAGSQRFSQYAT